MKRTGPLSAYSRTIVRWRPKTENPSMQSIELANSMLAYFAAGEAPFLQRFVNAAEADGTTYQ